MREPCWSSSAQNEYGKLKQENAGLKQENAGLKQENKKLTLENKKLTQNVRDENRDQDPVAAPTVAKVGTMQDDGDDKALALISRPEVDDEDGDVYMYKDEDDDDDDDDDEEDYKCFSSKEEGMITSDIISSHETMEAGARGVCKSGLFLLWCLYDDREVPASGVETPYSRISKATMCGWNRWN